MDIDVPGFTSEAKPESGNPNTFVNDLEMKEGDECTYRTFDGEHKVVFLKESTCSEQEIKEETSEDSVEETSESEAQPVSEVGKRLKKLLVNKKG